MTVADKLNERFYYGWVIVAVSLVSLAVWFGVRAGFSVYFAAMIDQFNWPRGQAAGVQSAAMVTYTLVSPAVGWLIDRFGPRRVIGPGAVFLAGGLALCATVDSLLTFYLYFGLLVGAGLTFISLTAYTAILPHWFHRRLGLASGVAVSGMGVGVFTLVPLTELAISAWDWQTAFLLTAGVVTCILLPLNLILIRHRPADLGLPERNGTADDNPPPTDRNGRDWTLAQAARTVRFWALLAFPFWLLVGLFTVLVHYVRFMVDIGLDRTVASFSFALVGLISSISRVGWGWLSDRIGREKTYTLGSISIMAGLAALWLMVDGPSNWLVAAFTLFFAVGWGSSAPMFMAATADLFGKRSIGLFYGLVEGVLGLGAALGSWAAGFIYDQTGSYAGAFAMAMAAVVVSIIGMWVAGPGRRRAN